MWFKCIKAEVKYLLPENKFKAEGIEQKAKYRICPAAGCIPERLQRHPFFERLVKEIN